ncbi:glycosyltransferase [Roseobacter sp. HKCC-CH-9208]|uniref:glycosyltransferase n=1 Tax=Roseobacter sp. HKCC-CH-9208 TaxID=3120339 RepID=UPI0030ECA18A
MKSMRLLMVADTLTGGGAERVILDLVNASTKREDVEIILAVSSKSGALKDAFPKSTKIYEYGAFRAVHNVVHNALRLREICKSENIDAIISHMTTVNKAVLRAKLIFPSLPDVYIVEHTEIARQLFDIPSAWKRFTRPIEFRLLYPRAKKVVTVSRDIGVELNKYCRIDPQNFLTILNPVDRSRGHITVADVIVPGPRGKSVISIGRLDGVKNFKALIHAFAKVVSARGHSDDRLVILGDGYQRDILINLSRDLRIYEQVSFPGFVNNIYSYLKASDLFVSTSRYEGLGNAMLEAISAGIPCIATKTAGAQELKRHVNSISVVEQDDVVSLASAILQELEQPNLIVSDEDQDFIQTLNPECVLQRYMDLVGGAQRCS